jgi:hypothetical protein
MSEIKSCPYPDQIKDCQDCVEKGLVVCGQEKEEKFLKFL